MAFTFSSWHEDSKKICAALVKGALEKEVYELCILVPQGCTSFLKIWEPLKNCRCQKGTIFYTEDPQVLCATLQNLVITGTWCLGFMHLCFTRCLNITVLLFDCLVSIRKLNLTNLKNICPQTLSILPYIFMFILCGPGQNPVEIVNYFFGLKFLG